MTAVGILGFYKPQRIYGGSEEEGQVDGKAEVENGKGTPEMKSA